MKLEKKSIKLEKNVFFKKSGVKPNMKKNCSSTCILLYSVRNERIPEVYNPGQKCGGFFHIQKLCML